MHTRLCLAIALTLTASNPQARAGFAEALDGKLLKLDPAGDELRPHQLQAGAEIEYFMIYVGASWCGPCRRLTPTLVDFYSETKPGHPQFEFVFVSADRGAQAMRDYVRKSGFPWPVLAWDQREAVAEINALDFRGIPYMAMLDREGKMLGASELGGFNMSIPRFLNGLQERLGTEVYDIRERHGDRSRGIFVFYGIAAVGLLVLLIRRQRSRRRRS